MRNLLIALVLGVTALTFYSALWFKSETIEDDITARVTEDLTSAGAENIDIDVDGRHVTLTGVVYSEATEDAYLQTADRTHGALGPIDGLTFQADGGYVSAVKSADGITLRGTVPNENARATLLAKAQEATDGTVDDLLVVSGPQAEWQDEATFGVGQLAGLTTGTLTAAPGLFTLSGGTNGNPNDVTAAISDRDGWSAFVSSPNQVQGLTADVDRLNTQIADRTARVGDLETTVSGLQEQVGTLTGERDAIGVELSEIKANLTEGQSDAADLRGQLTAATAVIGEKDQTINDLTGQVSDNAAQIATLETELENRQTALANTDDRLAALGADLETANGAISDLTDQVADRDETIASLAAEITDRDTTIDGLNDQVAGLSANADQSVAGLTTELAARDETILDLTAGVTDRDQRIANLTGTVAEKDATIEGLNTQIVDARGRLADATDTVADREVTIASLTAQVADLDGSVASTAAQIAALTAAARTSGGDVETLEGQVADLTETVSQRDETIASLQARPMSTGTSAEQCASQATNALEGSRINFETGSVEIAVSSVELLERLTGIALACVSEDLTVEIGGHTDALGDTEDNQALSETRAQAILDFMVQRGVPANGLRAVGFGETQPVADNDTSEGRAQNRRISFDWQAR